MSELLKFFTFSADQTRKFCAEQSVTEAPIVIGDVTIIPIAKISCGIAFGGADLPSKGNATRLSGGTGSKVTKTPLSFLAIKGQEVQIFHVSESEVKKKGIVDSLKPLIEKFKGSKNDKKSETSTEPTVVAEAIAPGEVSAPNDEDPNSLRIR